MMKLSNSMTRREQYAGWCYFAFQMLVLPDILWLINDFLPIPFSATFVNLAMFSLNFVVIVGIFHRFLWNSLKYACKGIWRTLKGAFLGFCVYYVSNLLVSLLIFSVSPNFSNINDRNIQSMASERYWLMMLAVVFLVPLVEETLYRGLLFGRLYTKSKWLGYTVSTALFAAVHVLGYLDKASPLTLLLCFIQYVPAGLTLAWAYTETGTIWAPILMHMTINQMGIVQMR